MSISIDGIVSPTGIMFKSRSSGKSRGSNSGHSDRSHGSGEGSSMCGSTRSTGTSGGTQGHKVAKSRPSFSWIPVHRERKAIPQGQPVEGHLTDLTQRVTDLEAGCA